MIHVTVHHQFGARGGFPGLFGAARGEMRHGPRPELGPAREREERDEDEDDQADDVSGSADEASDVAELREQVESLRDELHELSRLVRQLAEDKD